MIHLTCEYLTLSKFMIQIVPTTLLGSNSYFDYFVSFHSFPIVTEYDCLLTIDSSYLIS